MAAQSTFEAQSFLDHTSAPSSTTTSLATPSAMSTACDGGEGNGRMADSAGTPHSFSLFGVRGAPSVLPELPEPSARVFIMWRAAGYSDRHWQQVAPPGWASMSRRAPRSARAWSPWSRCTAAPPSRCRRWRRQSARARQKSAVTRSATQGRALPRSAPCPPPLWRR